MGGPDTREHGGQLPTILFSDELGFLFYMRSDKVEPYSM